MFKQNVIMLKHNNKLTWKNYTNCVITFHYSLAYKTLQKLTILRCHWKNDCKKRRKKQCHKNEHTINSNLIETKNVTKRSKKRKKCVKHWSTRKLKITERFISAQTILNKKLYTKQKYWNFAKWSMQTL